MDEIDRLENAMCARLWANELALGVACGRLLAALVRDPDEEEQDPERWDGLG